MISPTFFVQSDAYSAAFKATSWDDAMDKAAEFVSEAYYGGDEHGTQRPTYTVYRLSDGSDGLEGCESQEDVL